DLLDQRGGGAHAVVGLLVRLDHQRRAARDERGRLAGTAEVLDRRRSALEVGAAGEAHRVGGADGPAVFAGCHQVGYAAAGGGAGRRDGRGVVAGPRGAEVAGTGVADLRHEPVVGDRPGGDDVR